MGWRRGTSILLVTGVCVLAAAGTAFAAEPRVDRQAWAQTAEVPNPTLTAQPERVYVSARLGVEEARSYFVIGLADVEPQDVSELTLTLVETDESVGGDGARLVACILTEALPSDEELAAGNTPGTDCRVRVDGRRSETGEWIFDLRLFLAPWLNGPNHGLAIFPDLEAPADPLPASPSSPDTYRLALDTTHTALGATVNAPPSAGGTQPSSRPNAAAPDPEPLEFFAPPAAPIVPAASPESTPAPAAEEAPPAPARNTGGIILRSPGSANHSSTALVLGVLLAVMGLAFLLDRRGVVSLEAAGEWIGSQNLGGQRARAVLAAAAVVILPPIVFSDPHLFKWGFVLIFVTAAAGMHVLVNWTGQLSLAHAGMIGLPAFAVGKLSIDHGVSPILLLPVAVVIGAVIGAAVALPALRVRGFYITVITLAAGVAIERFFFTRSWLIGPGAISVPSPAFGPLEFDTFSKLYPWMALVFVGAIGMLMALNGSKAARAFWWVKSDPDAAAAAGINTSAYTILAYVIAGILAGLAGGLTAIWVRQLTPSNFPLSLAFTYLTIAVLAGPGSIKGLLVVVFVLQGLPLFHDGLGTIVGFAGPIAVLITLTRFPAGVNGLGRRIRQTAVAGYARTLFDRLLERGIIMKITRTQPSRSLLFGIGFIVIGLAVMGLAWYHTGNTDQVWIQVQEVVSGGLGGLALVIIGTGLVIRDQLARNAELLARMSPTQGLVVDDEPPSALPEGGNGHADRRKVINLRKARSA